ncbi:DEAD/DEAH box helicase [Smaragdicoccus niigatensis]|uniref:DEAD/DEAH box helicase n=1 Tax=Smaragdicoccus niigatensis TaxID=359359 RepID=UPI00036A1478|nr:DEAD/DEAH box helicase [Smaragdicoccus niigatensis]
MTIHLDSPATYGRELLQTLSPGATQCLRHAVDQPARTSRFAEWPSWVHASVRDAVVSRGAEKLWIHQEQAATLAATGHNVVIATSTASGKSLGYQLPVLSRLATDPMATALYISPAKALAADQLRATVRLCGSRRELASIGPCAYDGDANPDIRQWARNHSRWIFTNPDMLHLSVLGAHERWGRLLRHLQFVVIDECHSYRGLFGANVAVIMRRLSRLARRYGSSPTFILASATTADPAAAAHRLIGASAHAVTDDGSPQGARTIAFWEPPVIGENSMVPVRRPAGLESARLMAKLVTEGARTITFARSRRGAETTAMAAAAAVDDPAMARRIAAYRAGYLAEDRRALETAFSDGDLMGLASTNALELGIDIAGIDATVIAGFPGTVASFWQQAGRSGRRTQGSLVVMVARDDPMDTYLVNNPEAVLDRPVEASVFDPTNPYVLGPQLLCAAKEHPLESYELESLGAVAVAEELAADGLLRRRGTRWFAVGDDDPHADLDIRTGIAGRVTIIEAESGKVIGTCDTQRAMGTLHPGAVHIHQGDSYLVDTLDLDAGIAIVVAVELDWTTYSQSETDLRVSRYLSSEDFGEVSLHLVETEVTSRVTSYLRKLHTGEILDSIPLDMPPHRLHTQSVLYTVTPELLQSAGISPSDVPGSLHAAEHAAIGMLPLVATCDRWDIGGVSTECHADTGLPSIFVYDGYPGGAGFAARGHAVMREWLSATLAVIDACACPTGCPSCVQSPKCGNGNNPLDKAGAGRLLKAVLAELGYLPKL